MAVPSSPIAESSKIEPQKKAQKRTTCPGLRVKGGRIYDSHNGKTCHQCRQKTMDFTARCRNTRNEKQCMIMFCHKCLHNRYGENAEEMSVLDDWHCPKCRDICNCSVCMKKKGHKPTGIMVHTAKATGFSSVSQLLDVKGPNVTKEFVVKGKVSEPKKLEGSTKAHLGKENFVDGTCNTNSNFLNGSLDEKKATKSNQDELKEKVKIPQADEVMNSPKKGNVVTVLRRSPRKFILPHESKQEKIDYDEKANALRSSPKKCNVLQKVTQKEEKMDNKNCEVPAVAKKEKKPKVQAEGKTKKSKLKEETSIYDYAMDVDLPPGTVLTNVSGIDLVPQDAGYALQFFEFCSSFGEILQIRKGQPESVLRDILCGRRRRGKCSSSVQFIMQLLSLMSEEPEDSEESPPSPTDGETSWIQSLKQYLSEADLAPEDIPEGWFDKVGDRYEMLDSSQKLRLLTFLCDETLCTVQMRTWIEEQNLLFVEKGKELKENLNAAKEKEKLVKRKLQEDIVKALIAKNGAPLTISEHESIIADIKAESQRVQEEINSATWLVSKKRQRSDAVRTEPIIVDDSGHAFWSLKGMDDASLLLQDMGAVEEVSPNDKWFSFDEAEIKIVEQYMSSLRLKRHRANKLADETKIKRSSSPEGDSSTNDIIPNATNNCETVLPVH